LWLEVHVSREARSAPGRCRLRASSLVLALCRGEQCVGLDVQRVQLGFYLECGFSRAGAPDRCGPWVAARAECMACMASILTFLTASLPEPFLPGRGTSREKKNGEKKNGHGTSRPLRKEKWRKGKWPWHITPIAKRKMAMVHHAHCERKNGEKKKGRDISRPLRKEK
jgi:hypothetical protein